MKKYLAIAVVVTLVALGFRLGLALRYPNDAPDDGRLYAQIARNVLNHGSYSTATEAPHPPTFIRVPGYPLRITTGPSASFKRSLTARRAG